MRRPRLHGPPRRPLSKKMTQRAVAHPSWNPRSTAQWNLHQLPHQPHLSTSSSPSRPCPPPWETGARQPRGFVGRASWCLFSGGLLHHGCCICFWYLMWISLFRRGRGRWNSTTGRFSSLGIIVGIRIHTSIVTWHRLSRCLDSKRLGRRDGVNVRRQRSRAKPHPSNRAKDRATAA